MSRKDKAKDSEDKNQSNAQLPAAPEQDEKASGAEEAPVVADDDKAADAKPNANAGAEPESVQTESAQATAIENQAQQADQATPVPPSKNEPPNTPRRKKRGGGRFLLWLLLLLILGGVLVAGGLEVQRRLDLRDQQARERLDAVQQQLETTQQRLATLSENYDQLRNAQGEQTSREQQLQNELDEVQQALAYQRDRLRALSTTTREDWLLAEAEYLLKLANQRLLVERSTEAAVGLLQEADRILRDLEDPELTPLRRAIARDLTQLKLAARVDLEGLYLRLAALAESVPQLPTMSPRQAAAVQGQQERQQQSAADEADTWWQGAWNTLQGMFDDIGSYIRIRDHAERPTPILPPDSAQYLQQNLRLMLERAQLAAMREEADLYRRSLENVVEWARRYYPETRQLENFLSQVQELAQIDVQQELPDISQSMRLMTDYIDRLHKLEDVEDLGGAKANTGGQAEGQ